jgi:CRP-like cAMP-binding protein
VQKGKIEIWTTENDQKKILGTVGAGGIFGEMALIDNSERMASATAVESSVCIMVPERVFQDKMADADSFIVALLRIFCSNIRSMQQGPEDD